MKSDRLGSFWLTKSYIHKAIMTSESRVNNDRMKRLFRDEFSVHTAAAFLNYAAPKKEMYPLLDEAAASCPLLVMRTLAPRKSV